MKTFKRYFWTICATTYAGVFFLRIFHYGFIYEKPAEIILGCVPTVIITFFLIIFFSLFQLPVLKGFDKIIEKGKKDQTSLTKKDIARLMKAYQKYDIIIIIANAVGFLLGAGSTAIISSVKGLAPFNPITFALIEIQSVATGFMCYTVNYVLVKRIYMAGEMRSVGVKLSENLSRVQNVAMWASIDASIINMMTVPYGIILNSTANGYKHFIIYCLIAWATSLFEFFIVFRVITKTIQKSEKSISANLLAETITLAEATKQSAENSQNQTAAVKEIVATMHDSTELANDIGEKIKEVTSLAEQSRDAVISGNQVLSMRWRI